MHPPRLPATFATVLLSVAAVVTGCGDDTAGSGGAGSTAASSTAQGTASSTASATASGASTSTASGQGGSGGGTTTRVTLFHTSDEHGWLAPDDVNVPGTVFGGAAQVMAQLVAVEGFDPASGLLLSSGDSWTGPALSSWFQGEPAVEVFNAMGYAASALGNHEVDFGLDTLAARAAQATYPYLAANVVEIATGERPAYLDAFRIVEIDTISIALIGLAGTHTATSADPRITVSLTFEDPADTLRDVVPEARAAGAEVVVVLFHDCATAGLTGSDVPAVDLILAGHCHAVEDRAQGDVPVVESGAFFHGYTRVDLDFDEDAGVVVATDVRYEEVARPEGTEPEVAPDPTVTAIVETWQARVELDLGAEVGFVDAAVPQASWLMSNWITDSWLNVHPEADVALLNQGAMRQGIPAGTFAVEDVFGMLPFDNRLLEIELTGAELQAELSRALVDCSGGCARLGGARYVLGTDPLEVFVGGLPIDPEATYTLITPDYLYYGGGGYQLATYDDTPLELGENFRDPVVAWTTGLGTTVADPLEGYLDATPRNQ